MRRECPQLGWGHSSMSAVLARIRTQYHDELPVQVGRNLELTPLARQLLPQVQLALPMIERSLVLRERNLTRADEAAGVTQSAISNSLNKLASCSMTPCSCAPLGTSSSRRARKRSCPSCARRCSRSIAPSTCTPSSKRASSARCRRAAGVRRIRGALDGGCDRILGLNRATGPLRY